MLMTDLFPGVDPAQIAAIEANLRRQKEADGEARATRARSRHHMRRAKAQAHLADILPARVDPGDSWHVVSHGDIDALSYLRHALGGVTHFDHVLLSTWCIAREDLIELSAWVDTGRIDQLELYLGEIFPSQYGDEYEQTLRMADTLGVRLVIARNHSKVTLAANHADGYYLAIESSANVNTNPRIEQTAMHANEDLCRFYLDFFHGIRSIDKHTARSTG